MFAPVRAGLFAALFAVACVASSVTVYSPPAAAQTKPEKPFQREDLDEAAVRLEGQINTDAGQVTKPAAQLRREMEEAFKKNDFRLGLQLLGQLVTVAPEDGASWLRLARSVSQIRPANDRERTLLLERAATAGYIAYDRTDIPAEQGEALQIIGRSFAERRVWRPALDALRMSLDLREAADIRSLYERLRDEHGFRLLDYTVDADAASPRACFQFSETLPGKRTDFTPFVSVPGQDRPAVTANEKQLCVEGLKHGDRYTITLRAGLPSSTEPLARSADFTIYRPRPQADRALHRQVLRAAAHRPAGHPAGQRQQQGGAGRDLSDRRPQPDRHRARLRFPALAQPLRRRAVARREGPAGLDRRTRARILAEQRSDDRVPDRSGARRIEAGRLCDDGSAEGCRPGRQLFVARDPMVHRLRSRAVGHFRQ